MTLIALAVVAVVWYIYYCRQAAANETRKAMVEYAKAFPGRCYVCGYDRFGLQEGLTTTRTPHHCCEKGKWIE